jgi:3-dehydroquinate synthase
MSDTLIQAGAYQVHIGSKALEDCQAFLKKPEYKQARLFVLVDEHTLRHCLPVLNSHCKLFANVSVIEVESGESSKNLEVCTRLWKALGELGADRNSVLINLGGGVITDMGGFVASTFKRGIPFIHIPTTLLSQVDASVGGKVGVDLGQLKNEVGVFNSPQAVFIYPDFLKTLSRREMMSGFAEVIKHALIADKEYWNYISTSNIADDAVWEQLILRSVQLKNQVVLADPFEKDLRKSLNFGHTVGHALEGYFLENPGKSLLHGEAIAVGMIAEAYISFAKNKLDEESLETITRFILGHFGHIEIDPMADHRLLELMKHDKKNSNGELNFTLLTGIGSCEVNKTAGMDLIRKALNYYRTV